MKKIYIALIAIVLILMALGCSGNSTNTNTSQPVVSEDSPQPAPQAVQVKAAPVKIASWDGSAMMNTETFTVPSNEWKISWDTKPGNIGETNFIIYVYDPASPKVPISVAANVVGANKASTVMRGAGDYFLTINTAQPYNITVETI